MRHLFSLVLFVALLAVASPANAQLREQATTPAPVQVYDAGKGFSLDRIFSPAHFRMAHSLEMNMSSFGGHTSSLGMYTNSLMWQFNQKLAARVDVAFAYSPTADQGFNGLNKLDGGSNGRVFLRNAEIAYRPRENMELHFSVRQSPYGSYYAPGFSPYRSSFQRSDLFGDVTTP